MRRVLGLVLSLLVIGAATQTLLAQETHVVDEAKISTTLPDADLPDVKDLPAIRAIPDPLVMSDGTKVSTPPQWRERREQIKAVVQHYSIGHAPPAPGNVTAAELKRQDVLGGTVGYRLVRLSFGPAESLHLDVALFVPKDGTGPCPTFVFPDFETTPGEDDLMANVGAAPTTAPTTMPKPVTPDEWARRHAEILRRGYAVATYFYQQGAADHRDNRSSPFFAAYPQYDWATLAAWAWGMSRVADYLRTQDFADKDRLIVVGHSRVGKAALIAGAFDERFAVVIPNASGCGGTGAFRVNGKARTGKEGLEEITAHFPQWFHPRLKEFAGQVEKLPFDQNWLMALVAPRPLLDNNSLHDDAANGKAAAASYRAAMPVYAFLGVPDKLGTHFRPGPHALGDADWNVILDFCDHHLRGMVVPTRFDQIPDESLLH